MKHLFATGLLFSAISLVTHAETPSKPEPLSTPPPVVSPEIKDNQSVTFRLKAPNAKTVALRGQWDKAPLQLNRSEDGIWSGTFPNVAPGV